MDAPVLVRFSLWLRSCVACVYDPGINSIAQESDQLNSYDSLAHAMVNACCREDSEECASGRHDCSELWTCEF